MDTWRIHQKYLRHLKNSISRGSVVAREFKLQEEAETMRGRDSEVGGRFPYLASGFAERQKNHSEVDIGVAQKPLEGSSILKGRSQVSVL